MTPTADVSPETVAPVTSFAAFNLSENLTKAMDEMGFQSPTSIQEKALPLLLGDSHDFIGLASTGTGKTGAFGIPLIERIDASSKTTQALVLSPTRELALQVAEQLEKLGKYKGVRVVTIYGGASYTTQINGVKKGAHIIVATPGRLVDFLDQKIVKLQGVQTVVLDEADEMISMGFKDDLETILKATHTEESESTRASCKTWLFSATMSTEIRRVANQYLENPKTVQINKSGGLSETIEQIYYTVKNSHKIEVIGRILQIHPEFYGIVFCQTKAEVADVADALNRRGFSAEALHGDRTQREREVTLKKFRSREVQVIVATDVAARGLDVKDLTHVVNYNLPWDTESYVHRIGRTGRNGQKGVAISLINPEQLRSLKRVQMQTRVNMGKGKVPTADDVANMKIKQVFNKLAAVDTASPEFLLAQSYVEDLVKDQEELSNMTREEVMARFIVSYHPQVFIKNDLQLDFVGDRIPRELMPGDGKSRPPIGSRSGGGEGRSFEGRGPRRSEGPRYSEGRGPRRFDGPREERAPRRFDGPRSEERAPRRFEGARSEERAPRRFENSRFEDRPRRERSQDGDSRPPRRDFDRPQRSERSEYSESRRPARREAGAETSGTNSFFKKFEKEGRSPRREDVKGVKRHRASDKKKSFKD